MEKNIRNKVSKIKRNDKGQFEHSQKLWNLFENFEEGYIDNRGRFRVYLPSCPYQLSEGYVLRSYAVLWSFNIKIPKGYNIHHIDKNKLNDAFFNLLVLSHSNHSKLHNKERINNIVCICKTCKKEFLIAYGKLHEKNTNRGQFCSLKCYHKYPKSEKTKEKIGDAIEKFHKEGKYDKK